MDINEIKRGRLIDHIGLQVADRAASRRFYAAVLDVLNIPIVDGNSYFFADELYVGEGSPTSLFHLAFQSPDTATVDRAHAAGLAAGGRDNGGPGPRDYYAGFMLDPDGNNVEVVFHGPANRSADAVTVTWDN